jgi:hypothetical protein
LSQKIERQPTMSTSQPPASGPIAVVTPASPDHRPIAAPRSSVTNDAEMIARLPGVRSAAPMPCSPRAATSISIDGASAHSTDAVANHATPITYTLRRPSRSPSDPPTRISAASASVYALTVHCSPVTPLWRSSSIEGSASPTTELSRNAIPEPRIMAVSNQRP